MSTEFEKLVIEMQELHTQIIVAVLLEELSNDEHPILIKLIGLLQRHWHEYDFVREFLQTVQESVLPNEQKISFLKLVCEKLPYSAAGLKLLDDKFEHLQKSGDERTPINLHKHIIEHMVMQGFDTTRIQNGICFGIAAMAMQAGLLGKKEVDVFARRIAYLYAASPQQLYRSIHATRKQVRNKETIEDQHRFLLEIPAFFQGVHMYASPSGYPELFGYGIKFFSQNAERSSPFLLPKALERVGKLDTIETFIGAYTLEELVNYFAGLKFAIDASIPSLSQPIALLLSNSEHAISVCYDPTLKQWLFTDANYLPPVYLSEAQVIAAKVKTALSYDREVAVFITKIYEISVCKEHVIGGNGYLTRWITRNDWKSMHDLDQKIKVLSTCYINEQLYLAILHKITTVAERIINKNAQVELTRDRLPLMHLAANNGPLETVQLFIDKGADVNEVDTSGKTMLAWAVEGGCSDVVELLIQHGADVNHADIFGRTPLLLAVKNRCASVVELILKNGAEVNKPDNTGDTPLALAEKNQSHDIKALLLAYGAHVSHNELDEKPHC